MNKGHKKRKRDGAADPPDADERKPFKIAGQRGDVQRTPKSQISKHCSLFIGISPVVVVVGWIKRAQDSSFTFDSISCRVLSPRPLIKLGLNKKELCEVMKTSLPGVRRPLVSSQVAVWHFIRSNACTRATGLHAHPQIRLRFTPEVLPPIAYDNE